MPADRDLIADSRAMIASWEASPAVHDSLRHAEWAVRVVPLVLNVLEVRIGERDALRARVAALEAAQRPPLGYVVGADKPDRYGDIALYTEEAVSRREEAEERAVECSVPAKAYEVREVQP
ncbi:hypothetical protein [Nocardia brasiliensis]|uniref:hypothetical protein n=1 Tax=Nocardia brasiliensis TaxID=37326 RepID=UPI0024564778|nr:hypothetical protein [Nocardia brasiliensis]